MTGSNHEDEDYEIPPALIRALAAVPLIPEYEIEAYMTTHGKPEPTEKELRLLEALSHGLDYHHAAVVCGCSVESAKTRSKAVRYKLRAKNSLHAVALALRQGLIH